jgi:hypothetical protein
MRWKWQKKGFGAQHSQLSGNRKSDLAGPRAVSEWNFIVSFQEMCYPVFAFVALVTPLDSMKGAASHTCCPFFVVRLEAVERHQIAQE